MKYIKKPIPVEAFCPAEDEWPVWFKNAKNVIIEYDINDKIYCISILTLEGVMECRENDYIIQGIEGELYPCRRDIFLKTYEKFKEGN